MSNHWLNLENTYSINNDRNSFDFRFFYNTLKKNADNFKMLANLNLIRPETNSYNKSDHVSCFYIIRYKKICYILTFSYQLVMLQLHCSLPGSSISSVNRVSITDALVLICKQAVNLTHSPCCRRHAMPTKVTHSRHTSPIKKKRKIKMSIAMIEIYQ